MENYNAFEEPVTIVIGLSFPTRVETVAEAYAILCEWPHNKRDAAFTMAMNACRAAFEGEVDAETARTTFIAFARKHGILMPDSEPVIAAQASRAFGRPVSL